MKIQNTQFSTIAQVTGKYLNKNIVPPGANTAHAFNEILQNKQNEKTQGISIKFSKHANERLADRNINLTQEQMQRLQSGAKQANEKGINESLILIDDFAFIVNAKSNTVITAMDQRDTEENIYTNIDGAVII